RRCASPSTRTAPAPSLPRPPPARRRRRCSTEGPLPAANCPWRRGPGASPPASPPAPPLRPTRRGAPRPPPPAGAGRARAAVRGGGVWDVATGQAVSPVMTNGRPPRLLSLDGWAETLSPDGRFVLCVGVTGGDDILLRKHVQGQARVWDVRTGEPVTPVLPH